MHLHHRVFNIIKTLSSYQDLNRNSFRISSFDLGTWNKVTRPYGTVLINVDRRPGNRFHDIKRRPMTMTPGEGGGND